MPSSHLIPVTGQQNDGRCTATRVPWASIAGSEPPAGTLRSPQHTDVAGLRRVGLCLSARVWRLSLRCYWPCRSKDAAGPSSSPNAKVARNFPTSIRRDPLRPNKTPPVLLLLAQRGGELLGRVEHRHQRLLLQPGGDRRIAPLGALVCKVWPHRQANSSYLGPYPPGYNKTQWIKSRRARTIIHIRF